MREFLCCYAHNFKYVKIALTVLATSDVLLLKERVWWNNGPVLFLGKNIICSFVSRENNYFLSCSMVGLLDLDCWLTLFRGKGESYWWGKVYILQQGAAFQSKIGAFATLLSAALFCFGKVFHLSVRRWEGSSVVCVSHLFLPGCETEI